MRQDGVKGDGWDIKKPSRSALENGLNGAADFASGQAFQAYVDRARAKALYDSGAAVGADDHILTLITCDRSAGGASGRLIVLAVQE